MPRGAVVYYYWSKKAALNAEYVLNLASNVALNMMASGNLAKRTLQNADLYSAWCAAGLDINDLDLCVSDVKACVSNAMIVRHALDPNYTIETLPANEATGAPSKLKTM